MGFGGAANILPRRKWTKKQVEEPVKRNASFAAPPQPWLGATGSARKTNLRPPDPLLKAGLENVGSDTLWN